MNSVMQALLWMMGRSQFDTNSLVGTGAQFFRSMLARTSTRPINLLQESQWCSMLNGCGEFILQQNDFGLFSGTWQARSPTMAGDIRCIDQGPLTHPLILHLADRGHPKNSLLRLQMLLDDWHRSWDRFQGLVVAPPVIALQLHRFVRRGGRVQKCRTKVMLDSRIYVLVFQGAGHASTRLSYRLYAFIEHHGQSPDSGHYTAMLVQDDGYRSCDDGISARWQSELHPNNYRNCYTLL